MAYFNGKAARYYYDKKGSGQTIILAHGLFVDHSVFEYQIKHLQQNYSCYAFDLPGHGKSTYNPDGWTLEDIAEDFKHFIEGNHIQKATLIGLSQGGMIFTRLAAKYPDVVEGLILVGSSHKPEPIERIPLWKERVKTFRGADRNTINKMMAGVQQMIVSPIFYKNYPDLQQQELKVMQRNDYNAIILATYAAVINRSDITGELHKITCPTLIVCGEEDHATPKEIAQEMTEKIDNSRMEIFSNAGHHIPIEVAEKFTEKCIEFMNDNPL